MKNNLLAQVFNVGVTTSLQLVTPPLLLAFWGVEQVGTWLVVVALAANAVLSELGFTYVAKTEMVIGVAAGDAMRAQESYRVAFAMVLVGNAALALLLGVAALRPAVIASLAGGVDGRDIVVTFLLLALNGIFQSHTLLVCAGQRAAYGPALETTYSAGIRLAEFAALATSAYLSRNPAIAAFSMCAVRGAANLGAYLAVRHVEICRLALPKGGLRSLAGLARPALAYLVMPGAQAILIQMPVIVLGALTSSREVVQFVAMRTVARVGTTLMNMINNTTGPEYSKLYGEARMNGIQKLLGRHLHMFGAMSIGLLCVGALLGDAGVRLLTHRAMGIQFWPFMVMLAAVVAEMAWTALFTPVAALNRHAGLSVRVLLAAGFSAVILYPLTSVWGLMGTVSALFIGQALALASSIWMARGLAGTGLLQLKVIA